MKVSKENRALLDETLGNYLRELREQSDYSIVEMAKILNLSKTMLYYIENGERMPTMKTLFGYANLFSIDIKELIKKRIITAEKTFEKYGEKTPHHVMSEYYITAYYTLLT